MDLRADPTAVEPAPLRVAPHAVGAAAWRASPPRLLWLLAGLWLFGTGEGLVVCSTLGNSPWTVLSEGVGEQTGLSIGVATIAISVAVLLLWLPLRQRPGLGTVGNVLLIGVAIDVTVGLVGHPDGTPLRAALALGGIAVVGLGSGLYLGTGLGPGARDGLMTGLHRRSGHPIAVLRTGVELTVLVIGALLGGTVGVATAAFALLIGPAVQTGLRLVGPYAPAR
ncbi:membrane protein YczE [Patulibacter defluvii]|uniref:membrane protein YczE n=1 Tax=Patulibacter defluvii TaxID=3095358 RepID=UPI002A7495BA|nr:hypothetical protein [Patulibacter sp. DM4]